MTRALPALAVGVLLFVAGCSGGGLAPGGEDAESEVASLVTDMDVSDARELATTHRRTLANASGYRGVRKTDENGVLAYKRSVLVDRSDRQFVQEWRDVDHGEGEVFVNASGEYRRSREYGDESFQYTVRTGGTTRFADREPFASELPLPDAAVLARFDFEYVRDDGGLYYFEAEGLADPDPAEESRSYWAVGEVADASARLVVHEDGYLREFSSTVTVDRGDEAENTTVTRTLRVWAGDEVETDARQPHWVPRAVEETE